MAEQQSGDKTEDPTPHRLREARDKGQIAKSREITTAVLLLASYVFLRYTGESMWRALVEMTRAIYYQIPDTREFSAASAGNVLLIALQAMVTALAPIFAVVFIAALAAEALQTGFLFSGDPLSPKWERINPLENFKKMFAMQGLVELIKSILKIGAVFWIMWGAVKNDLPYIVVLMDGAPWDVIALGASIAFRAVFRVGIFFIFIALLDYLYRRHEYMKNLKMTKQEVKEEYKRLEGDPLVRQRIREMQRQIAYQRMMANVPKADVVVTNPTHIAVALRYDPATMAAPILLAKGMRKIAEEIRRRAEEAHVPILERVELARTLYRTTGVNREVPAALYKAVAEVLAFVYKRKRKKNEEMRRRAATPTFREQAGTLSRESASRQSELQGLSR